MLLKLSNGFIRPFHQLKFGKKVLFNPKSFAIDSRRSYFISKNHSDASSSDGSGGEMIKWKVVQGNKSILQTVKSFAELSKLRLSTLVVLTTMSGHVMATSIANDLLIGPTHLLATLFGTALCSFSANSLNQWAEASYDAQMPRTQNRPLPRLTLTPFAAFNWACGTGALGVALLASSTTPMAAGLAGLTIVLYAGCYTPLKRISITNTWVGALVGAIPPLIGWTSVSPSITFQSLLIPAVLFCWQFPHFNALSWNLRAEYARAGYRMAALLAPKLNGRVALRYAIMLVPLTIAATLSPVSLATPIFAFTGNLINAPLIYLAFLFNRDPSRTSARKLFFASLLHLPLLLLLLFIHKRKIDQIKT